MNFWIITFIILLDQASKVLVLKSSAYLPLRVAPFLDIVFTYNKGISFGIFNNAPHLVQAILLGVNLCITAFLVHLLRQTKELFPRIAFCLIIGGAVGNIIDRIWHGAVIDFLDVYWLNYHWYTFNIADSTIVVGASILLWTQCIRKSCASS